VFLAVGYLAGLPVLAWTRRDLHSFRHILWAGYGNRESWIRGATIAYLFGGWPVFIVAMNWRKSTLRAELVNERDDFRAADDSSPG